MDKLIVQGEISSKILTLLSKNMMRTFTKLREFSKHYNTLVKQLIEVDRKYDKQYKELKKALGELIAFSELEEAKVMGFIK